MLEGPKLPCGFTISAMAADEVPILWEWARLEGWNPGLGDIGVAWRLDPGAFLSLRHDGELVGGGTIYSHHGAFGFMGLFIVRADLRGQGLGTALWFHRRDALVRRLHPGASIGMDGVFDMVPFYARGGFELAYRDLRFDGIARGERHQSVVDGSHVPFALVDALDTRHFPTARTIFLKTWLAMDGVRTAAVLDDGILRGFAALRPCEVGHRFGPVLADDPVIAERLIAALMHRVDGEPVQLDVPECNEPGLAIAERFGMTESFGCARMYFGGAPEVHTDGIFGVTSFEFG